jgi:hypothetical protein
MNSLLLIEWKEDLEAQTKIMTPEQLFTIKKYQREFKEKFNTKLEIDWDTMNNIGTSRAIIEIINVPNRKAVNLQALFEECVSKHNANAKKILDRKIRLSSHDLANERSAVEEFSKIVIKNRLSIKNAAKVLNRDRTSIYSFV